MNETKSPFATVEEAVEEIRQGRMIVLIDDEDRENEGDLAMAAEKISTIMRPWRISSTASSTVAKGDLVDRKSVV